MCYVILQPIFYYYECIHIEFLKSTSDKKVYPKPLMIIGSIFDKLAQKYFRHKLIYIYSNLAKNTYEMSKWCVHTLKNRINNNLSNISKYFAHGGLKCTYTRPIEHMK